MLNVKLLSILTFNDFSKLGLLILLERTMYLILERTMHLRLLTWLIVMFSLLKGIFVTRLMLIPLIKTHFGFEGLI